MLQGFFLGLSNGTACLASCAPIMLPYLLGGGKSIRHNLTDLIFFLTGRLGGYLCFGVLAWIIGRLFLNDPVVRSRFLGISFLTLGVTLIVYNVTGKNGKCGLKKASHHLTRLISPDAWCYPFVFGLFTGINVCPPFLLVFTDALNSGSLIGSALFFTAFFLGTSLFFVPLPFLGAFKTRPELKTIGEMALYLVAVYYLIKGLYCIGGIV